METTIVYWGYIYNILEVIHIHICIPRGGQQDRDPFDSAWTGPNPARKFQAGPESVLSLREKCNSRFPSNPLIMKVPFLLIFSLKKRDPQIKREKVYHWGT